MLCSSTPVTGVSSLVSCCNPGLIDIGRAKRRKLALKVDVVGDFLDGIAQLVHQQNAEGNLALKLVS